MTEYFARNKSSFSEIYNALRDGGSMDGCDPDWCRKVLENASPDDISMAKRKFDEVVTGDEAPVGFSWSIQSEAPEAPITRRFNWMCEF